MPNNLRDLIVKRWYFIVLLLISVLVYWRWLSPGILTHSDLWFQFNQSLKENLIFPTWISNVNFGSPDTIFWRSAFYNLPLGLAGYFGLGFGWAERISVMLPIIVLGPISGYLLCLEITKNKTAAFMGALIFAFNTYFLAIDTQGHLLLTLAAMLSNLCLWMYLKGINERKIHYGIGSSIMLFAASSYDLRFGYILILIIFGFIGYEIIFHHKDKPHIRLIAITTVVTLGLYGVLNLYWLLPVFLGGVGLSNDSLGRDLFGSGYWKLTDALTLHHPFWTGGALKWFSPVQPQFYLWLLPILASLGLFYNRKEKRYLFIGIIALAGVFLSKQVDQPFGLIYIYLYDKLPGFNAFREATKFYYPVALGYSILIAGLVAKLTYVKSGRLYHYSKILIIGMVIIVTGFNVKPMITGEIGTMFTPRSVPNDYLTLQKNIDSQHEFFRTYWLPSKSRWSDFSNLHPYIDAHEAGYGDWLGYFKLAGSQGNLDIRNKILNQLNESYAENLFSSASIKYVVVPPVDTVSDDDFYQYSGYYRPDYIYALDHTPWLKKVDLGGKSLTVYENMKYSPYITSYNRLTNFDSYSNLSNEFNIAMNISKGGNPAYTIGDSSLRIPHDSLADIYSNLNRKNIIDNNNVLTKVDKPLTSSSSVITSNAFTEHYKVSNNVISVYAKPLGNISFSTYSPVQQPTILNVPIATGDTNYYYSQGADLVAIDKTKNADYIVPDPNQKMTIYSTNSQNVLTNGSFENGLWQQAVSDCNNFDSNPIIGMSIEKSDVTDGRNAIELFAGRHTACTGQSNIKVEPGEYSFTFDYKTINTNHAGYVMQFNDAAHTLIRRDFTTQDKNWHSASQTVGVPAGASTVSFEIEGFPTEDGKNDAFTKYDNFSLKRLTLEGSYTPLNQLNLSVLPAQSPLNINYIESNSSSGNLLSNPSFENGLWQQKVGDCNAYDSNPKISMTINKTSSSDGQNSLELGAQSHIACTADKPISVSQGDTYLFSIDYQSNNAQQAGYTILFNDKDGTRVNEKLNINDVKWHTATYVMKAPVGATSATISLSSFPNSSNSDYAKINYDNVFLGRVPDIQGKYFISTNANQNFLKPKNVSTYQNSPVKKTIQIKGAKTDFYISMAEAYSTGWQIKTKDNKTLDSKSHFKFDGYSNGWFINLTTACDSTNNCVKNSDGSYDLTLVVSYSPQNYFYLGILASTALISMGVGIWFLNERLSIPKMKEA